MKKATQLTLLALLTAAVSANAAIVGFEAESGTLGIHFDPAIADVAALGGEYITTEVSDTGSPNANKLVTYSVTFAETGTYDLYGKIYVGPGGVLDDSFFFGDSFGTKALGTTTGWITANGLASESDEAWAWVNLTEFTATTIFTASIGDETFEIAGREDGLRFDAFAFGTSTETFSDAQLDAAVIPEPGTYALLAGCFALASVMIRRRR